MADAFDLDAFAPRAITFTLRGHDYGVSGDPDVDVVAQMLRIEQQINDSEEAAATIAAAQEGKQLLLELIHEHDPDQDLTGFKVGPQDVVLLFALIMHGSSVAAAVAEAITQAAGGDEEGAEAVRTAQNADDEGDGSGESGPLGSTTSSSEPSSSSDDIEDGLLVTGSA